MKVQKLLIGTVAGIILAFLAATGARAQTTRVSVASGGTPEGNNASSAPAISSNGRYVAFQSLASNLVPKNVNNLGQSDVFVHDRQTPGTTTMVSVDSNGNPGNDASDQPSISADGRYVAFHSTATNLVTGDTRGVADVFVHDLQTGETTRVSVDSNGNQGNNASDQPSISADGRYVAFHSTATNLVAGDTNGVGDVFVHDRQTGKTTRVSVDSNGVQGNNASSAPAISSDGRYVAFQSLASNLVPNDNNLGRSDVFVYDRQTGETTMVSVDSDGNQGNNASDQPSISADGTYVAFHSTATNLVTDFTSGLGDVFVHDRRTDETTKVSVDSLGNQGNNASEQPSISADGRYVAFHSIATNLVTDDTNGLGDVFVHDRQTPETTTRVSVTSLGNQGNNASEQPSISADGRYVAFQSTAANLVPGDTNGVGDVFVHDSQSGTPAISTDPFSLSASCAEGTNASNQAFQVANLDGGTLSYTISVDADWLSCSPSSGTSTGAQDTITVSFMTSGLAKGTYSATITVTGTDRATGDTATNSPQTIPVSLTVNGPSGDHGGEGGGGGCFIETAGQGSLRRAAAALLCTLGGAVLLLAATLRRMP